jgi:hypothetical protein
LQVYENAQKIEDNTQNNTQKIEDNTQKGNQSENHPSQENTSSGCGCIILLIMFILFASFNSNKDACEQHQDDPPAAQPYNYPAQ